MCGIAGIISTKEKPFDYSTFCHLGIDNDSRGGDSCGIFIDGKYEYGIGDTKLFVNFMSKSQLLNNTETTKIALLHCRKASVGAKTIKEAQPVIICDDKGTPEFVVLHNGTIHNYEELAEKYIPKENIDGLTDSQVMAKIFYSAGYDVLNEYYGGAVFVIVDYRKKTPEVLFFKGASKASSYAAVSEERPLFYAIDEIEEEICFSSILPHLIASRYWVKCASLTPNKLYKFTGKTLTEVATYSREKVTQRPEVIFYTGSFVSNDNTYVPSQYMWGNITDLKYTSVGKALDGKWYLVSDSGQISKNPVGKFRVCWFFDGVLLKSENAYNMLLRKVSKSKLSMAEFIRENELLIRFLSKDQLYVKDGIYYKVTGKNSVTKYTGMIKMISSNYSYKIVDGIRQASAYCFNAYGFAD